MTKIRLRLLSYVVMAYMLLAFTWWSLLLFTKNRDAFYAKRDLLKIGMIAENRVSDENEFRQTIDYQELVRKYKRQEWMIFGEASMFIITLLTRLWFINQGYSREVKANEQGRNFLLSITHELKSPIASIRLVLETLMKRELPKDKTDHLAASALKENERLLELVENLLLSAKLETAYQPNFEPLNLVEMLEDLAEKLMERHAGVNIILDVPGDFPFIKLDKSGIVSVATNLMENAIKYSDSPAQIGVYLCISGKNVVLEFSDEGHGIPDKEKKRIFNKFYRIGNEETRKTKGTGLGLYIVHQIVKAHSGHISVKDNSPKGTVFRIEIPV